MPVWPICFWMRWPTMPLASYSDPTAITSMSWIVTPPSSRASRAAPAPRSIRSLSSYRRNGVIDAPRIQMSSLTCSLLSSSRDEAERDGLGPLVVGAGGERRQPHRHAELQALGIGLHLDDVGLDDA